MNQLPHDDKPPLADDEVFDINMSEDEVTFIAEFFAALGNPIRLRIAELLARGERTVNDVAQSMHIQQPNASLNLAVLHRAGIVKVAPRGARRYYSVRGPRIARILLLANEFRDLHEQAIEKDLTAKSKESGAAG